MRSALAAVLVVAALSKLASPTRSRAALASLGLSRPGSRSAAWLSLSACELLLGAGVAAGSTVAAYGAAVLLAAFALWLIILLRRGAAGAPCGCFGSRSRVGWLGVARNVMLSAGFALVPALPAASMSMQAWLAVGLAAALLGIAVLGVVVLALAREVGMLRLRLPPQGALEIPHEGPPLGRRTEVIERFHAKPGAALALAVFSSEGCRLCQSLAPAVAAFERDSLLSLEVFDEERDREPWRALGIPGAPYAVALDRDGIVRAKGTFNSFGQLESIVAAAERRARDAARV